jgi:hypothetical protein
MARMPYHFRSVLLLILVVTAGPTLAQPQPPDFCFVISQPGNADDPLDRPYEVNQHYQERVFYYNSDQFWLKPDTTITLQSSDLFKEGNGGWRVFTPVTGVAESRILVVIAGTDTMRIDLPDDMQPLIDRAWARWDRPSPDVIRFRKGRYAVEELIAEPRSVAAANTLAKRLITADDAAYKQDLAALEEYYRTLPPPVPPVPPYSPPPPMTEEGWAAYWAQQPPLKEVHVDRVSADTVWVRLTGRVMLDGGCASGMPLFGIEMRTDTGWVERIPFDLTQMDCGMPWADWDDRLVTLPALRWRVSAHQPEGKKTMSPGRYRLFFVGGDLKRLWTEAFNFL